MKIKINGSYFYFFKDVSIQLNLDSVGSLFSILARFNPDNPVHREIFRPLSYHKIEFFDDDEKLMLTGVIVNHNFTATEKPELVKLSGYSLGGILEDISIPYSSYPLESIKRSLKDVCERLFSPFNLKLIIDPSAAKEVNQIYEKTVAKPDESIKSYISKLTSQRNIVLSHDEYGNILMFKPTLNKKTAIIFNNENTQKISLAVNGQSMHSEISVIRQPSISNKNISPVDTVVNSMVSQKRTLVKVLSSGSDTDTKNAANNTLSSELKNISIGVELDRVVGINPGDVVEVESKNAYLYTRIKFMVSAVNYKLNESVSNTSISLVLPETYTGDLPKNIFK